jgi:hypothetical protein
MAPSRDDLKKHVFAYLTPKKDDLSKTSKKDVRREVEKRMKLKVRCDCVWSNTPRPHAIVTVGQGAGR